MTVTLDTGNRRVSLVLLLIKSKDMLASARMITLVDLLLIAFGSIIRQSTILM